MFDLYVQIFKAMNNPSDQISYKQHKLLNNSFDNQMKQLRDRYNQIF